VARLDTAADPKREYDRKCMTAEAAAGLVKSGDLVWIPSSHASPAILAALAARESELRGVRIRSVVLPDMGWFRADARRAWDLQVQYTLLSSNRKALAERIIDFHPFSMISQHKAWDERPEEHAPIDVLMLIVSPPNDAGWVCVGNACWDAVSSVPRARRVIAEESAHVPLTCGDSWLHVSQLDAIVRGDRGPVVGPDPDPAQYTDVDRRLAANLRSIVRDGDTLQIGLGRHTAAVTLLGAFEGSNDLGYFGELTVPGTVALARRGIVTCRRTEVHPGRFVACHIGNSPEDLEFIAGNPFFELHSYEHTNDPRVIARHDQMLAINGALMVDLSGQIGVYALGPTVYTGLGGQLAFHLGAHLSRRGRAVTLLPSQTRSGISTIVPQFERGQVVSIPREIADTVVTDHGVARLLGRSVRERAEQLIHAAHPDHRDRLRDEARRLFG
jgi:4-hydroxybutyrate CoA-transferase